MIRSMTGFGEGEMEIPGGRLHIQIKTVNHRFFNANVKSPPAFDRFDHEIQGWIRRDLQRGHVTVSVTWSRDASVLDRPVPEVDLERARAFSGELERAADALGYSGPIDFVTLLRFGDLLRSPDVDRTPPVESTHLQTCVESAVRAVVTLREAEGARLEADLRERLAAIGDALDGIEARAPHRLIEERDRLRAAIAELTESDTVDEERLAREIAHLAERWDINEELVRFRSHIELVVEALDTPASEPTGKRLGFLVQEMLREANTIGSKANDAEIAHAVVSIKEEIERLREQVENIE